MMYEINLKAKVLIPNITLYPIGGNIPSRYIFDIMFYNKYEVDIKKKIIFNIDSTHK